MSGVTINPENTDRAQLASLGDSATIRPDSATRRNCWTCRHDELRRTAGGVTFHVCRRSWHKDVVEWIEQHVAPDSPGVPPSMPPRDAPPCPVWKAKDEPATVKDSLVVRMLEGLTVEDAQHIAREHNRVVSAGFVGWRGHLPLCRGPGGIQARRLRALVRGVRR